uniref:DNA repair protein RAD50 n=1 Tax=Phallusia mammillata TaxID=59560 RepID=A0A6F9DPN7_9ASCI|nr:DNA repair protein RAD50 [Phallusia mammillata]
MSMIETMSIMGIRAFGPNDKDQQVIKFEHPLTLLVGPNGAGKTTIIECLKYATTGDCPLNTKGGAFVHDPKLAHESEVRAKVRLKCKNLQGQMILVERGLQAIQKARTIQFKTLDGVITKERNGERVSITSKCAELNKEMVITLGVSKAVLNNVIFCHQEESNWPLSEGKSVKQKFDDIFAATRYIKALDEIRKIQKTQNSEMKQENVALEYLESNSKKAASLHREVEDYERKLEAAKQSSQGIREKLMPIKQKMLELSKKQSKIITMDGKLGAMKSQQHQMVEDEEKLRKRIRNIFRGTDEQLSDLQNEQGQALVAKERKQQECEKKINPLQREITTVTEKKTALSIKQGKLQQEIENAGTRKKTRTALMREYKKLYKLNLSELGRGEITEEQVKEFISIFQDYINTEARSLRSQKVKMDAEVKEADSNLRSVWQEKTEVAEGRKLKEQTLMELKRKQAKIKQDLSRLQVASDNDQLDVLQSKLDTAKEDLEMLEMSFDVKPIHENIKKLSIKKSQLPKQIEALEHEISELQKSAETRTKLEMIQKDKQGKEESIQRMKNRHQGVLQDVGIMSSESSPFPEKGKLSRWIMKKEEEVATSQQKLDTEKRQVTQLTTERDMLNKEIKDKKKKQEQLDEELFELCGSQDLESDLARLEKEIQELQGNKGLTDGIQFMYKKFIKKLNPEGQHDKTEVPCPLCQRLFEEASEIDELVESLQQKLELVPKKLDSQMRELKSKQDCYRILQNNKPKKLELDRLGREIPNLRHRLSDLSKKIGDVSDRKDKVDEELTRLKSDEDKAKSCVSDVAQIDTLQAEVKDLDRELRRLESRIPMTSSKSLDDVTAEKKELSRTLNQVMQEIENSRREIQNHTTAVNEMKEKVNSIKEEKLQLASDLQKCQQLKEQHETLSSDIARLKKEIEDYRTKLAPLERRVEDLETTKKRLVRDNDELLSNANQQFREIESKMKNFQNYQASVEQFEMSGTEDQLQSTAVSIEQLEAKIVNLNEKTDEMRQLIAKLQKDIATCTDRQRDLEDNAALRERKYNIEKVNEEIEKLEQELGGMDAAKLNSELHDLNRQCQSLNAEEQRSIARQEAWKEEMKKTRRELAKDEYKYADEKYKQCLVNSVTLELASQDLGKYYKALDRAIMRFHQIKMDEINKIIRDLWQQTYRGKDIDYIEICSSEDTAGSTSTSRRVFNYRVVMHAGDTEMDMRGRCSAGQKVLASLVIRLALAETFCINCGILALDEPTTNLDRDNIESLAQALVSIIESRSQQRNFQLLVITHDEDFVELLGRSRYVDNFLRITKDDRGKSRVTKCDIRTLER